MRSKTIICQSLMRSTPPAHGRIDTVSVGVFPPRDIVSLVALGHKHLSKQSDLAHCLNCDRGNTAEIVYGFEIDCRGRTLDGTVGTDSRLSSPCPGGVPRRY